MLTPNITPREITDAFTRRYLFHLSLGFNALESIKAAVKSLKNFPPC